MKSRIWLFHGIQDRLQNVLVIAFTLIAVVTSVVGIWTTSVVVNNYAEREENLRVGRDMNLALAFYERSLMQIKGVAANLASEPTLSDRIIAIQAGDLAARAYVENRMIAVLDTIYPAGSHFVLVLDDSGRIVTAYGFFDHRMQPLPVGGDWSRFAHFGTTLRGQQASASTEVIDEELLAQIGLAERARIALKDTPKARSDLFDPREGTAGLVQIAWSPILNADRESTGAVIAGHLINNDFTLVDRIQAVAGVDTVTIFFGDLRVSTNVREDGERALGTRLSEAVFDTVLSRREPFTGNAYVVNEWFITRYVPLFDHSEQVVGILYVGARRATFTELQRALNSRIAFIFAAAIVPVALLALLIARVITRPLEEMARASRLVAQGNTQIRIPEYGIGEVAVLGRAFNTMLAELAETQARLIRNEKLASMGQLAAGVAHQLNNPLGSILLFSDIVVSELPDGHQARPDVQMIAQEAHRAKEIVTGLLNFARQQTVWTQPTAIGAMLHELVERARQLPKYDGVEFVERISPNLPDIEVDPAQMPNVFVNLMENAVDAMPDGGTMTIKAGLSEDRESIVVTISDTGCGIPPENINEIFSPFFTTKPFGQGTGLGLAIAYGIIKKHQGIIQVKSKVNEGTEFVVRLPIRLHTVNRPTAIDDESILLN
ncbi:MAG: HAMP domain-containing protein [Chloroflexi bacterium]|nr:HAMP domain-containing protein [Chloroflexota bacterium]